MKKSIKNSFFCVFLAFFSIFFAFFGIFSKKIILAEETNTQNVEHFFTHCLIVNSKKAFDKTNFMAKYYDKDCLTSIEFERILNQLYNKNYCLINANETFYINNNGMAIKKYVKLPNNKKPLILSIDDVNYDSKKMNLGMADKIALDDDGKLCSIIDGKCDYNLEFISILDNFIQNHKDFSYNNAKLMLCLTGYDGILGYRTNNNINEFNKAKKVVEALKNNGYYFACHSYGHYHMKDIADKKFKQELDLWKNNIEPLIGKTNIYVYPYGEHQFKNNDESVNLKHKMLVDYGFKLFCGVGEKYFFTYYPFKIDKKYQVLFMDRRCLDGFSLRQNHEIYNVFFDCYDIYDKKNRKVSFY